MSDWVELSIQDVEQKSKTLAAIVSSTYTPDCVVFVARGGYLLGRSMAEFFAVPLAEISAKRCGGGLKKLIFPLLQLLPRSLSVMLRRKEFSSGVHKEHQERRIEFDVEQMEQLVGIPQRMLLVDDSVDTGHTILQCKHYLQQLYPECQIKVAALNVWSMSCERLTTEYTIWRDTILLGPWSNDSKEKQQHDQLYLQAMTK